MQFKGDVQVADLHTIAGPANDDLVKWRNLAVTGIDLSHNPDRLTIERIVARQPYARVIIRQDQTLNVAAALKRDANETTEHEPQPATPSKPTPVRIKTVTVTGGSALFADYSITPSFATGIVDLDGTIIGTLVAAEFARESAAGGQGRPLCARRHHGRSEPARAPRSTPTSR